MYFIRYFWIDLFTISFLIIGIEKPTNKYIGLKYFLIIVMIRSWRIYKYIKAINDRFYLNYKFKSLYKLSSILTIFLLQAHIYACLWI